jgi:hypothetical protein
MQNSSSIIITMRTLIRHGGNNLLQKMKAEEISLSSSMKSSGEETTSN